MSGYSIANLKELPDTAAAYGLAPELEARFARDPLGAERTGVSYQRLAPHARHPFGHRHREDEEIYVVVGGSGRVKLDDEIRELGAWDAVRVAPGTTRCFEGGPDGIELLAFGTHAGASDVDQEPGWWAD